MMVSESESKSESRSESKSECPGLSPGQSPGQSPGLSVQDDHLLYVFIFLIRVRLGIRTPNQQLFQQYNVSKVWCESKPKK